MLESAVRVIRALWRSPDGATLDAPPYRIEGAVCDPPPLTPGGPRIWLGTQGLRRGLRIVAELADGWNDNGRPDAFRQKLDALLRHCDAVGRNPAEIEISAQIFGREGPRNQLEVARRYVREGAQHVILLVEPASGPVGLQRLVAEVAVPLREAFG
jgi:alkanesulfonate monooxygenase SsuD/methylene tetrahydromethanopterin reductase-like flavin-dependent oxidoreductase (luciferase family)